jgi:hypothetical protein
MARKSRSKLVTATKHYPLTQDAAMCYIPRMAEKTLTLSFRLPERLVKRIDTQADKETRLRTNMVQVLLQEALDKREELKGEKR